MRLRFGSTGGRDESDRHGGGYTALQRASRCPTGFRQALANRKWNKIDPGQRALVGVCAGLEVARCSKGHMPSVADDDMIVDGDPQDAARVHQHLRHREIGA